MASNYVERNRDWRNSDNGTGKTNKKNKYGIESRGGVPMPVPTQFKHDLPGAGNPKSKRVVKK